MAQYNRKSDSLLENNKSLYEVVMVADSDGNLLNSNNPIGIQFGDTPSVTAFSRARVANSRLLGEYRYMYGSGTTFEFNTVTANNASLTVDYANVCAHLTTTTQNGSSVIHQTKQYHPYIAGTSNLGMITFVMDTPKANVIQSVGMFDADNGIIFRVNGNVPEICIKKDGVITEVVPQSQWDFDKLDGSYTPEDSNGNPSGINIDFTKGQILVIDYQWLGLGRVRVGFDIDGVIRIAHHFEHANHVTGVYMNQPSLPIRWEVTNTGNATSNTIMKAICGAVYCEGSDSETGFSRSISTDGTPINVAETEGRVVLAIRMQNTVTPINKKLKAFARLKNWSLISNNDVQYKIIIFNDDSKINTPSWINVPGYTWCQYTLDKTLVASWAANNDYAVLMDSFVSGSGGNSSGQNVPQLLDNRSNAIYQNYDSTGSQVMAIVAYKLINNASIRANLSWIEVK